MHEQRQHLKRAAFGRTTSSDLIFERTLVNLELIGKPIAQDLLSNCRIVMLAMLRACLVG
jgi:hypothetical protein